MKTIELKERKPSMHDFGFIENDQYFWWASWYADVLGYKSYKTLLPSILKAKKVCAQLGIDCDDNFVKSDSDVGANYKLTKFACFLVSLQADGRKPIVKRARTYFLNELEELHVSVIDEDFLSRSLARDEIKNLNKKLSKTAMRARVKDLQYFTNEGYMGMYNKTMNEIKQDRGVPQHKSMNDFMSIQELSANLFRITLTIERLKHIRNPSEEKAAREHWKIGSQIRSIIKSNTGSYPEELPVSSDINQLQKKLKQTQQMLNQELKELAPANKRI